MGGRISPRMQRSVHGGNLSSPTNLGLIGCGRAAERLHLPALLRLQDARLVAVADPCYERRTFIAKSVPGCVPYSSAEALLQKAEIVALIIASPPNTHVELIKLALLAELPALVEKPVARDSSEIQELCTHFDDSRKPVMVMAGFNRRFWEPACRLRRELLVNNYSNPLLVRLVLETNVQDWAAYSGTSDALDDLGPHQFDLLRYLFDCELLSVSARWINENKIHMKVGLDGDIMADCLVAHGSRYRECVNVEYGRYRYRIRTYSERIRPAQGAFRRILDGYDWFKRLQKRDQLPMKLSFERQLACFLGYVRSGEPPQPGLADGIAAVRAVEAARESIAKDGRRVWLR